MFTKILLELLRQPCPRPSTSADNFSTEVARLIARGASLPEAVEAATWTTIIYPHRKPNKK